MTMSMNIPDRESDNGPPDSYYEEEILLLRCSNCGYEFFNGDECPACKESKLKILSHSDRVGF